MKELQDIVAAFEKVKTGGKTAALATLVKASGSTYRRPGARMLMTSDGQRVGSLSGGCLEGDVFEQAQEVMTSGKPVVVQYDTMSDEDIIWGLGLGCNGIVQILIERVEEESPLTQILHHPPSPSYQRGNKSQKLASPEPKGGLLAEVPFTDLAEQEHLVKEVLANSQALRAALRQSVALCKRLGARTIDLRKGHPH